MFKLFESQPAPRDDRELQQEAEKQRLMRWISQASVDELESLVSSLSTRELNVFEQITGEQYFYNPREDEVPKATWDEALEASHPGSCWKVVEADYQTGKAIPGGEVLSVHAIEQEAYEQAKSWNMAAWGEYCTGCQITPYVDVVK